MCVENLRSDFGLEPRFTFAVCEGPHDSLLHSRPAVPTVQLDGWAATGRSQGILPKAGETVPSSILETMGGVDERKPGMWTLPAWSTEAGGGGASGSSRGAHSCARHSQISDAPHGSRISADREHHHEHRHLPGNGKFL